MPRPEIEFDSPEEELKYGVKVLLQAGLSPQEIEKIREKNKPGQNFSKDLIGLRRYMVQELLAANLSNRQIANVLQIGKDTVNLDRNHNRALYTEKLLASADVHRARLLKEQMDLKEQALRSFDESKKKKITVISEDGRGESNSIRIEESAGDHGFLNVAKNSLVEQAKLLGLHELKREESQDKTYRQFLQDLSSTIDKEKELKAAAELKDAAFPIEASSVKQKSSDSLTISFDLPDEVERGPNGAPLQDKESLQEPFY